MKLIIFIFIFAVNGFSKEVKVNLKAGYDSNTFQEESDSKSAFPLILSSTGDYCYGFNNHCPGTSADFTYGYYTMQPKQSHLLYKVRPYYAYDDKKNFKFLVNYTLNRTGEESNDKDRDFRYTNGREISFFTRFYTLHSDLLIDIGGEQRALTEEDKELDYLNVNEKNYFIKLEYFTYPETSYLLKIDFSDFSHNETPSSSAIEEDYTVLDMGLGWSSTISKMVNLKMLFSEKRFSLADKTSKYTHNFELSVDTKLISGSSLGTNFYWVTNKARVLDARFKVTKGTKFSGNILLNPTTFVNAHIAYELSSYAKPYPRNELIYKLFAEIEKEWYGVLKTFFNFNFDFIKSDDKSLSIYGTTKTNSYSRIMSFCGVKYEL